MAANSTAANSDGPPVGGTANALSKGDPVEVFYRFSQDSGGYFPVALPIAGSLRPRFGRTDGWIQAAVWEDWPPMHGGEPLKNEPVVVRHTHPYWSNREGEKLDPASERDMVVRVPRRDVRAVPREPPAVALSLLVVRWGGEPTLFNEEQWGAASASVTDTYIAAFIDGAVYECLGPDFEVLSAFVQSAADLQALSPGMALYTFTRYAVCVIRST